MVTLCRAYESTYDAETAIERVLAADLPPTRIELIMGRAFRDASDAPIGTFAGTTTADAVAVGSFGNIARSGSEATGTFAHSRARQRRGSFGDADRDTVTTYRSGATRTRIASHSRVARALVDAGLDQAIAAANVGALHAGRVLVLVHSEGALDEVAAVIDVEQTLPAAA